MKREDDDDAKAWFAGWRIWLAATVIMSVVWGILSLMQGRVLPFWPGLAIGIWAAVLLVLPLFPASGGAASNADVDNRPEVEK